jgi:hypothetical protein
MATRTISFHTLVCDGPECGVKFGMNTQYVSIIEVRAAAYGKGWRFPDRITARGESSKTVNDVCPKCWPEWERQPAQNNWASRKTTPPPDI